MGAGVLAASHREALAKPQRTATRSPNIVLIIADDLGVYDLGAYGQQKIQTPHMDDFARQGVRFTEAYGGAPICAPSRCALVTGRHMGHATIRDNFVLAGGIVGHKGKSLVRRGNLAPQERTVATYLQAAGYRTGLVGKWHLDGYSPDAVPTEHGFDEFHGWLTQTESTQGYFPTQWYSNRTLGDLPDNAGGRQGLYETDLCTDQACDFIRRHRNEPFFLMLAYNAPHSPYVTPALVEASGQPWGKSEKTYAAMVEMLDMGIGSVMRTLAENGLDEETIVFVTSDHGPRSEPTPEQTEVVRFFGSHGPLRGYKRDLYEGGIRVPLLVRAPGRIMAGRKDATPIYHPDFLPTALRLAGLPAPADIDGRDMTGPILSAVPTPDRLLYWETYEPSFWQAARLGRWKAVRPPRTQQVELYDLSQDPSETHDLAATRPDVVRRLARQMREQRRPSAEYPVAL